MVNSFFNRNSILILAILASLVWHTAWLSVIRVVAPDVRGKVKFSKVAFLGQVLDRGVMEIRMSPRERSFLENRYLALMQDIPAGKSRETGGRVIEDRINLSYDEKLIYMVDEAVSGQKIEPAPEM